MKSRAEFEAEWERETDMSIDELQHVGIHIEECHCDYGHCPGWVMVLSDGVRPADLIERLIEVSTRKRSDR